MVYSPREDSYLLKKWVSKFSKNKKVLDMGTGSGILAITAKSSKASKVLGVDKNKEAITLAKKNAKKANLNIEFKYSDLFLTINEKFDLIIFNPPYLPLEKNLDLKKDYDLVGGIKGNELSIKFLKNANEYLNEKGIILMICSSLSDPFEIFNHSKNFGYQYEILDELRINFEVLYCVKFYLNN